MKLQTEYDIVVVGAGPSGSMAAYEAAKEGASVLLLEKDREIGNPVRCAEAVGKDNIEEVLKTEFDHNWLAATITKVKFISPDGTAIVPHVNALGYVLNRKLFDYDLAKRAAKAGAEVLTKAYVQGLLFDDGAVSGVECNINGKIIKIKSKIVIGADGVESRVGRWAGIDTTTTLAEMESCCQATLTNLTIKENTCLFYFSQKRFPGGYGWVFPKGEGIANVGIGISGDHARKKSASKRLEEFIDNLYPNSSILSKTLGGVPCAKRLKRITGDGILLVGDAVSQGNPMTGAGIVTGMIGGEIGGQIAAKALQNGTNSSKYLIKYEKEWDKRVGNTQKKYYKLKKAINKLTDDQLNRTAHLLKKIPPEEHTLLKIFKTALLEQPSLFLDIVKLFSPFS